METIDNLRFLALHSSFPWLAAAFFAALGLWFGHVLWYDWVRQLRPLRAEHDELSRRLEGLKARPEPPIRTETLPMPPEAPPIVQSLPEPVAEPVSAPQPAPSPQSVVANPPVSVVANPPVSVPLPVPSAGAMSPEFWPIPEKAPVATVLTGEVVSGKVLADAALLVGIPVGRQAPDAGKES